jgi:hypothetical protein
MNTTSPRFLDQMDLHLLLEPACVGKLTANPRVFGTGDKDLDVPDCVARLRHEAIHRLLIGDIELEADHFPTLSANASD